MRFKIPGRDTHVRLFEPVQTNTNYRFVDLGIEYADGTIDSLALKDCLRLCHRRYHEGTRGNLRLRLVHSHSIPSTFNSCDRSQGTKSGISDSLQI